MQYCSIRGVEADKQRRNFGCRCSIGHIDALQNTKKLKQANQKRIQRNRSTTKYKEIQQNQERLEDLAKWEAESEQSLKVILGSWKGMQVYKMEIPVNCSVMFCKIHLLLDKKYVFSRVCLRQFGSDEISYSFLFYRTILRN